MTRTTHWLAGMLLASAGHLACATPDPSGTFVLEEATIADIHTALKTDRISCHELVNHYLARIAAYDKTGPAINALVVVNEAALTRAHELDRARRGGGPMGPLHCIPVIVKDNFDTIDLPTTAGSLSLEGFVPSRDAFQVRRIREAGGIVMAKSNMAEFAFSPYETVSSILPGYTRNPYALVRVTAGSSGGTAAAISANFGGVGLGSDTGNSIRGPSAHQSLVGIRSTMGLTSRAGIVPLNLASDIAGPMTRSVADAAAVLEVIEGYDLDDPVTEASRQQTHQAYAAALDPKWLEGTRLGVLRWITNTETTDSAVLALFESALDDIQVSGATLIDPFELSGLDILLESRKGGCHQFKFDLNAYLAGHGDRAPVQSLEDIIQSGRFHPSIQRRLELAQATEIEPVDNSACQVRDQFRQTLRDLVLDTMDTERVDALVYPTWNNRPRLIGDLNTPHGDNNQLLAPSTGFPAITVPMGYIDGELPAGLQFFGRPWDEFTLIGLAYAYEQATHHRRPPESTPPLE